MNIVYGRLTGVTSVHYRRQLYELSCSPRERACISSFIMGGGGGWHVMNRRACQLLPLQRYSGTGWLVGQTARRLMSVVKSALQRRLATRTRHSISVFRKLLHHKINQINFACFEATCWRRVPYALFWHSVWHDLIYSNLAAYKSRVKKIHFHWLTEYRSVITAICFQFTILY